MKLPRTTGIMAWAGDGRCRGLLGAVLVVPLLAGPVGAQQTSAQAGGELAVKAVRQIEALLTAKVQRTSTQKKVSSQLLDSSGSVQQPSATGSRQLTEAGSATDTAGPQGLVTVDIRADVTPVVLERIRALGGTVVNSVPKYRTIRAQLGLAALEPLATLEAVQFIRIADQPITHQVLERSAVARAVVATSKVDTTEGDVAHQANVARQTYSVDGTGIGIGVISDGVDTLADQQATGDVPARVTVLPGQAGGSISYACGGSSSGTEGTAMLEIIHDLAPGAELYFADGIGGSAQMAQNIENLCATGAHIIVDDIGYLGASAFQDDVIAQAVSAVAANGCYYFSSAGNGGNLNDGTAGVWEGDFAAGGTLSVNGMPVGFAHDFGGGVTGNRIKRNSTNPISLQWSDPAGGSENDYDLFLIDADDNVLASSTNTQDGTQDPIEWIRGSCSDDREDTRLIIVKNTGAADRYLRLNYARGGLEIATAGHTFGHSASKDAMGVAAVDVTTAGGAGSVFNGTESVETFSSDGPRRIFFEADGTPITAGNFSSTGGRVLQKPDLAAADAVSTSTPGFSPFRGTSAAAPHAAAIAALMLEAADGPGNVTLAALRTAMTGAALDIEATGIDRDSGAGIVMAPGAVDAVDVAVADRNGVPTVSQVEITSRPERAATYAARKEIAVTVTFSETVVVTGTPRLRLNVGGINRTAAYRSGTDEEAVFVYMVADGESDTDGVSIEANSLTLNGGRIRDGSNNNALPTHDGLAADVGHKVDGVKPALVANGGAVVNGATLTLTYGEALDEDSTPALDDFTVTVANMERRLVEILVSGSTVTLTVESPAMPGEAITVSYTAGAHPIRDAAGNPAKTLNRYTLPPRPPPPPPPPPPPAPPPPGPRQTVPDAPTNLLVVGGNGQVVLTWDAPEDDGGTAITNYEYRIDQTGEWIPTGSTATTHTVTGLVNGTAYVFEVRAVNEAGNSAPSNQTEATPELFTLDFAHFANGEGITSELVLVNVATHPIRIGLDFYDQEGNPIDPESVVDLTGDLEITEDGGLSIQTEMEPLGELTISTHGRGEVVSGSVKAVSNGPMGGVLRFGLPDIGVAGVGASLPLADVLFPARRAGGISTAAAIRNLEAEAMEVSCRLIEAGAVLEEVAIHLEANGQEAQYIEEMFTGTDISDFVGSVRCMAPTGDGMFTGVAVELDAENRIFTTLPVVPVDAAGGGGRETVLDFAHFANGAGITSELVFVNRSTQPSRPAPTHFHSDILPNLPVLYFYDQGGALIDPESVVDVTGDLVVTEDSSLTVQTEMEPLGVLTISTHGRGELLSGSVKVTSDRPLGGFLRFSLPDIGVAGVGVSLPVRDAIFPARRQEGGISTAAAIHNLGEEAIVVSCRLMKEGTVLEEVSIPLAANGQEAQYIEEMFTGTDTSDFVGSVRCMAPTEREGMFTGVAVELDGGNRIFTTLPVVPVQR